MVFKVYLFQFVCLLLLKIITGKKVKNGKMTTIFRTESGVPDIRGIIVYF